MTPEELMLDGACYGCDQDPTACLQLGYCVYERKLEIHELIHNIFQSIPDTIKTECTQLYLTKDERIKIASAIAEALANGGNK